MANPLGGLDDLIMRLGRAANPSEPGDRLRRITAKVDDAYASGNLDRAARWDERIERWLENRENAMAQLEADGPEISGGHVVDDAATGVSPWFAARYAEYIQNPQSFAGREGLVDNLRAAAEHGTGNYPTPKRPDDQDVFDAARQIFEDREALRQRYRQPQSMRVIKADELIERLR